MWDFPPFDQPAPITITASLNGAPSCLTTVAVEGNQRVEVVSGSGFKLVKFPIQVTSNTCQTSQTVTYRASLADYPLGITPTLPLYWDANLSVSQPLQVTITPLTGIGKGQTADVQVTLDPSPSPAPVTLILSRTSGTGEARFASNDSTMLNISQSMTVKIKGVTQSSTADNIRLEAKIGDQSLGTEDFSVVWVTLSLRTSGSISMDNSARASYIARLGTEQLGTFFSMGTGSELWRTAVEVVGAVEPSNFTGVFNFARDVDLRTYEGMTPLDTRMFTEIPVSVNTDPDPQSDKSGGKIYNFDAPGIGSGSTVAIDSIFRVRTNFRQRATFNGLPVSDDLLWFSRISIIKTNNGDRLLFDISNEDNKAGPGTTKLTWNLQ